MDNSCPITSLQYTTSGLSIPMYADGDNWNRTHYINFPSQEYVKNLIQQLPYVQASVTGSYRTVGHTKNKFSAAISTMARASSGGLKTGWNLVTFSVGAGADSTYSQTGNKFQTKTSFTNGNDDSPTSYVTKIQINARCTEATSNSGWLNSYTINFLKS